MGSMALRCFPSLPDSITNIQEHGPIKKPLISRVVVMLNSHKYNNSQTSLHNTLHIRSSSSSSFKNKVYEDESKGIICYRDEKNGEIICEGYDEGPRLLLHHNKLPTFPCNPNPAGDTEEDQEEIIRLLQRIWLLNNLDMLPGQDDY